MPNWSELDEACGAVSDEEIADYGDHLDDASEPSTRFGCLYPNDCIMPGPHMTCECATAEFMEEWMSESDPKQTLKTIDDVITPEAQARWRQIVDSEDHLSLTSQQTLLDALEVARAQIAALLQGQWQQIPLDTRNPGEELLVEAYVVGAWAVTRLALTLRDPHTLEERVYLSTTAWQVVHVCARRRIGVGELGQRGGNAGSPWDEALAAARALSIAYPSMMPPGDGDREQLTVVVNTAIAGARQKRGG